MSRLNLQPKASIAGCEETRGLVSICELKGPIVCPTPRRVGILANNFNRPLRFNSGHQSEICDSKAGSELMDIILKKEGHGLEQSATQVASSPPFFCGSPPSRADNPIVLDARFGEKLTPTLPLLIPSPSGLSSPSASAHKGGCARTTFGLKPAAVRVEGFDCLNRDRQNSRIPAMA